MSEQRNNPAASRRNRAGGGGMGPMGMGGIAEKPSNFKSAMKSLIMYCRSFLPAILISIVFAIGGVILLIFVPKIVGYATDTLFEGLFTGGVDTDKILDYLILASTLAVVAAVLTYIEGFVLATIAQKLSYNLRKDVDSKINKLPLKYYDTTSNGVVLSYLTNDIDTISNTLNQSLAQLITSITTIAAVLVMMFTISWEMTLIAIIIMPLSMGFIMLIIKFSQKHFIKQQKLLAEMNSHIEENFAGHKEIQLYNHQNKSIEEFILINKQLSKTSATAQFLSGLMMPVMMFMGNIGYVAVCIVGGVLSINTGAIMPGSLQAFLTYMRQFNQPIAQLANVLNTMQSTAAASERVFKFLAASQEVETGNKVLEKVEGNIKFQNVRFGYDEDKVVINDFSCDIESGKRIAIVGPTGAGKTTIVKLLMRFYELNGGNIYLDGIPLTDFSRNGLRNEVGMVLQDTWLYNGTIMENIRYGKLNASDNEVIEAAKTAGAHHFIKTLEGGYDFVIDEEAGNISQGQKQLLTIARAILKNPRVLILDEATSSVDTRTEQLIIKAMEELMKGKTSFVIAHRLSTIRDADLILVMNQGDIIEQGKHEQLLKQNGFYATLYNSQFSD